MQLNRHVRVAVHEIRGDTRRLLQHLYVLKPIEHLFPENSELHLSKTIAHTAMDSIAEGDVLPGVVPIDDQTVRVVED